MTKDNPDATPGLSRRMLMRGGLLTGFGVAVAGVASPALTGVAQAATVTRAPRPASRAVKSAVTPDLPSGQTQNGWAYCKNCAGLWYTGNHTTGYCPYQGGGHIDNPSFAYAMFYDVTGAGSPPNPQPGWSWCSRCQGLFDGVRQADSWCPAPKGGHHTLGTWNYSLNYNQPVPQLAQPGWYWCFNCQGLFYGGPYTTGGYCPANGFVHDGSKSDNYDVTY
jgi:hypothetical protein